MFHYDREEQITDVKHDHNETPKVYQVGYAVLASFKNVFNKE